MKKHFQAKLDGRDSTMQALIDEDRSLQVVKAPAMATLEKSLEAIPSLTFLVGKNAHAKMKGTGENRLGGEISRLLPRAMARVMHPLHCKASFFVRLPVQ